MIKSLRKICGWTEDRARELLNTSWKAHSTDLVGSADNSEDNYKPINNCIMSYTVMDSVLFNNSDPIGFVVNGIVEF